MTLLNTITNWGYKWPSVLVLWLIPKLTKSRCEHLDNGDNALYLLSMIAYQFKTLLTIKENPRNSGLHPFVVQKTLYLCNQFTAEQLKKIYQNIFQADLDIKTGKIDPELALELLLFEV